MIDFILEFNKLLTAKPYIDGNPDLLAIDFGKAMYIEGVKQEFDRANAACIRGELAARKEGRNEALDDVITKLQIQQPQLNINAAIKVVRRLKVKV